MSIIIFTKKPDAAFFMRSGFFEKNQRLFLKFLQHLLHFFRAAAIETFFRRLQFMQQTQKFPAGTHRIAVKVVDLDGLESLEVVSLKINGVARQAG